MSNLIKKYSEFIAYHPFAVLVLVILVSAFAAQMAGTITTKTSKIKDFLPPDVESIRTLNIIENEYGSTDTIFFTVETDPLYKGSDEVRDVRDPRVMRYLNLISERALHTDDVIEVTSAAQVLKSINNGRLPQSIREVQEFDESGLLDNYVSRDHTLAIANIRATDEADLKVLEIELNKILVEIPKPPGIMSNLGGTAIEDQALEKTVGPDMGKTSMYSLVGILAIILLLFRSIKYGFTPLTTIVFGSLWAMGFVGFVGMELSSTTSGVLSMIMGIGIDFGIQV